METGAFQQIEDGNVSEEFVIQPGNKNDKDLGNQPDHVQADQPLSPSWRTLEPKSPDEEDLASILQAEFATNINIEEIADHFQLESSSGAFNLGREDWDDDQPHTTPYDQEELARLAATVFDTTFYLVPRLNNHYLLGELAQNLRAWMPTLCEMYGWALDRLSIRPDYLRWTLLDFPECLTRKMLDVVRRWTSARILRVFPALQVSTVDQDFWAPGHLVDTQNRDFPTQVLIAHVSRDRSGFSSLKGRDFKPKL